MLNKRESDLNDENNRLKKNCEELERKMRALELELDRERITVEDLKQKNAQLKDDFNRDRNRLEGVCSSILWKKLNKFKLIILRKIDC